MDGYLDYGNLLSSAIADQSRKVASQKEEFEGQLETAQEKKSEIMDLTNLAVMPFEAKVSKEGLTALSKGVDKISGGKITEFNDFINGKLQRVKTNAENQLGKLKEKITGKENTSEDQSGESGETEPQELEISTDGTENIPMENLGEGELVNPSAETGSSQLAETSFGTEAFTTTTDPVYQQSLLDAQSVAPTDEELIQQGVPRGVLDLRAGSGRSNVDVANGQASSETADATASTEGDAVNSASSNAVSSTAESAGIEAGETAGETAGEIAGATAGETAVDVAGASLMDNPFTFFIGLAMMIGGIVGGVEGSRSVKQPTTPKPPPIANVSTQFGM